MQQRLRARGTVLSRQRRSTIFTGPASLRSIVTSISFLIWRNVALDWEGARCRTHRTAEIQHLIQRQLTILHRILGPETRHGIRREAQRINRIREMPAFLVIKCRRGTREADPHSRRAPPKLGGALRPDWPEYHVLRSPTKLARVSSSVRLPPDNGASAYPARARHRSTPQTRSGRVGGNPGRKPGEVSGRSGPGS